MTIKPIRTEADHDRSVKRMERLWNAAPDSAEAAELDALATLVDAYEARRLALPNVAPIEILNYAVTEMGHTQAELAALLGSRSRAREVLNGKRELTVEMIRKISSAWRIPTDLLVGSDTVAAA